MIDYLNLYKQGDSTIQARCNLLKKQRENIINKRNISVLITQYKKIYNRDQNNNIINMEILRDDSF